MKPFLKYFGAALLVAVVARPLLSAPYEKTARASPGTRERFRNVKVLFAAKMSGDRGFARRLMREMEQMGFVWTRDRAKAHAFVEARGDWDDGAFNGALIIRDRAGKVLWNERSRRPQGSNVMAYQRLADKLRADLGR